MTGMGQERTRRCEVLANELREVSTELRARLRVASLAEPLSMSQTAVLARLHKFGPMTVADLARAEHVKPQSMGATVVSLEADGLVARSSDPDHGRRLNVSLTEAGKRALLAGRAARQAWLSRALEEHLDVAEQKQLLEALSLLKRIFEQ
jgi:DNA-binding MarR family transcriptional regulator